MTDLHTENARLRAALEALVTIVEGIDGAMNHGTWRDDKGMRLKDTPQWVALYVALATPAPDAVQEAARVPTAQDIVDAWLDENENFSTRRERMMDYCFRNDTSHNIMTSWLVAAADAALRAIAGDRT